MGIRGLTPQVFAIPLAKGLQQATHKYALEAPGLATAINVQFDDVGALQSRRPCSAVGITATDGVDLANIRRLERNGSELLAFTKTALYSRSSALSKWVRKGTHLAVKIDEVDRFTSAGDQFDVDRAELDGVAFYSWTDGGRVRIAAIDTTTKAMLLSPTAVGATGTRARLVALATKVLLIVVDGGFLYAIALDPATPSTVPSPLYLYSSDVSNAYDICRIGTTDSAVMAIRRTVTTSYSLLTIDAALNVVATVKARTCTGAIAVSVEPTGTQVQVVRANGTNVQGDLITISGLADVYTAQAIGTTPVAAARVIAACHRSVQNSAVYRCYVFWASSETSGGGSDWYSSSNWVSTGNTLGSAAIFKRRWAPRARAFDRDGEIYVWGAFYGRSEFGPFGTKTALQSSYFLLRDDGFLCAKAVTNVAGAGAGGSASDGDGWIPGCQDLGSGQYAFAAVACRVIKTTAGSTDYAARTPREVVATFDSDQARRCARLGQTLYFAAGEVLQYDGAKITEVGFHQAPWYVLAAETATGGITTNGSYALKNTWRSANARGETERSTSFAIGAVDVAAQPAGIESGAGEPLYLTHRDSVAWEVWRTTVNPGADDTFHLVTGKDPSDTSGANCFVFNDPTAGALATFDDELSDDEIEDTEEDPETGGVLESVAPPPASIIIASADRLFLAGIADNPHQVRYSKLRGDSQVAAFSDGLSVTVPQEGGAITGLAFVNQIPVAFKETAIYALDGSGLTNLGTGDNFDPRRIPADVGAINHESLAETSAGVVFKSKKGWYLLNHGWTVQYIGEAVSDYDAEAVVAVHVVESQHQVRCLTSSRMLVWDYKANEWAEWTIAAGVHAAVWDGVYHYATSASVLAERSDYAGIDYGVDVETAWIPLNQVQGFGRVWKTMILGEYRGAHTLRVRVGRDRSSNYFQDKTWTPSPTTVGGPVQLGHEPSIQEMQAIRVRITAGPVAAGEVSTYSEALKLVSLALELGVEQGLARLPAAQRQ